MKNLRIKQMAIVTAISLGMIFPNIDPAFALSEITTDISSDSEILESSENSNSNESSENTSALSDTVDPTTPESELTQSSNKDNSVMDSVADSITSDESSSKSEMNSNSSGITETAPDNTTETDISSDTITETETSSDSTAETDASSDTIAETDASSDTIAETETPSDNTTDSDTDSNGIAESDNDSSNKDIIEDKENSDDALLDESNSTLDTELDSDEQISDILNDEQSEDTASSETSESEFSADLESSDNSIENSRTENISNTQESTTDSSVAKTTQSQANISHQETTPVIQTTHTIKDNNKDAIYIQPTYKTSELFIDIEDRIKYNTALPLDNIPSFITQEMIIGALKCQDETSYPASVTIAQIILESGFGNYGPGGDEHQGLSYLAFEYCNLFGIKGMGTAGSVDMRTGEQASTGEYYTITAGFRVYNTYTECIEDRTDLLKRVYSDLTEGVTDANTFARRIGSRWATSLQYSENLIKLMERYDLYRLDRMTLQDFSQMIGKFADPCPGSYLTSSYGYRTFDNSFHKGIDLGTNGSSIPTYAAESGTVIIAGYNASAGNWIIIDHGNGLVTKYMHHSHIFVSVGDEVEKGQQIGLTGNTGNSSGVHLHFQVEENGVAVDPTIYLTSYTE